jgi:hypothetical protein
MLALIASIFLRIHGEADYNDDVIYISDFGFYAGGHLNVTWDNSPGNGAYSVSLQVFTRTAYDGWLDEIYETDSWRDCNRHGSTANITTVLTPTPQHGHIAIPTEGVFIAILQHCLSPAISGRYTVDITFMNPNGQHLDSREVPLLTVLPVMISVFGLLLFAWIGLICVRRSTFLGIYICLVIIVTFHVLYLIFYEVTLYRGQATDRSTAWSVLLRVAHALYEMALYSTLVIASSGWCLLNVPNPPRSVLLDMAGVLLFVASAAIDSALSLGSWQILLIILEFAGIFWIVRTIVVHTRRAQLVIKAHLLLIQQQGIMPSTTPIYEKMALYEHFLFYVGVSFLGLLVLNVVLSSVDTAAWIIGVIENIMQLLILGGVMYIYRPRGRRIDPYMRRDGVEAEEAQRDEILLEDLESYDPKVQSSGMREWEDGMALPLEPLVVQSRGFVPVFAERKRSTDYTLVGGSGRRDK